MKTRKGNANGAMIVGIPPDMKKQMGLELGDEVLRISLALR